MPAAVALAMGDRRRTTGDEQLPAQPVVQQQFERANATPEIVGTAQLPSTVNFLHGSDPKTWHTGIPTYAGIVYHQLYPGIELRYEGVDGQLKGRYLLAPGADASRIR